MYLKHLGIIFKMTSKYEGNSITNLKYARLFPGKRFSMTKTISFSLFHHLHRVRGPPAAEIRGLQTASI